MPVAISGLPTIGVYRRLVLLLTGGCFRSFPKQRGRLDLNQRPRQQKGALYQTELRPITCWALVRLIMRSLTAMWVLEEFDVRALPRPLWKRLALEILAANEHADSIRGF